ncbi:putative transcription factor bZIP family [Helianthus annuus]|nr:putative transcription factor bZIP family [Helianthus annuus]KAJ0508984.1 putative transcription factor bZIP family [Helianthus annuus]KAJ0517136.1 putative transcription factor bZIP family [Helianthus annuus]KAJ0685144.1 putative transcription factor bZIP family [Helianthus annuus]KAJ0689060.1 putative transcription factor bZIP family [Helianthus annuus]
MASSKVMASSSPANQDLQRHISDHNNGLISMNMDDLLKNIYDGSPPVPENFTAGDDPEMTLEDFLTKAGAVREEDVVKLSPVVASEYSGVIDPVISSGTVVGGAFAQQQQQQQRMQFNGVSNGGGRGKRKVVVEDPPVDKATQQKQRRMIKNRESAARSRERKQAYTVELESLVTQLEEEHARLLKEVDELNKERLKQLMENLMPVAEKRRPPRLLRRTNSM